MEQTKIDAFLDTNVFFDLVNLSNLELMLRLNENGKEKIPLLNFNSVDKPPIYGLEETARKLSVLYQELSPMYLCIPEGVKKQIDYNNIIGRINVIDPVIEKRIGEYAFIQLSQRFGENLKQKAWNNLSLFLSYQQAFKLTRKTIESIYQPSVHYNPINDFLNQINHVLKIKKEDHKFDFGVDQKLVACVLDNSLIKKRKTKIVSKDNDVKNLFTTALNLIFSLRDISEEALNLYENMPELYSLSPELRLYPTNGQSLNVYLESYNETDQINLSGYLGKSVVDLFKNINALGRESFVYKGL